MKTFFKYSFNNIKGNISRIIAMLSIILLSAGVITGLLVSAPNMQMSMSKAYYNYNTADINLKSEIGFDLDSIDSINNLDDDFIISGVMLQDKKALINNYIVENNITKLVQSISINSLLYEMDLNNNDVNILEILDSGKLPSNEFEILAQRESNYIEYINIGDTVEIDSITYTVSGIVNNTWYTSKEAQRSIQNSNSVKGIFYKNINSTNIIYSDIFISINKSENMNQFLSSYDNLVKSKMDLFNDLILKKLVDDRIKNIEEQTGIVLEDNYNIYVLNRSSNQSYQTFKTFVSKVSTITQIFPIFFLIVSILVVLSSMTRNIEEERQEIGILRSLGYSKLSIYIKYLLYTFIISILGVGLGYSFGFRLIPSIINSAFEAVFYLPVLTLDIYSLSNIIYLLIIIVSMLITTAYAVSKTLKKNVSALLVAKSPKYGKRIVLENIGFIWNKLKFKYKSSIRNLFRYPNHFIMTVIGIAGSLALIITGIGLINSISAVTTRQYKVINKYDFSVDVTSIDSDLEELISINFNKYLHIYETTYMVESLKNNENIYVNVIVVEDDISDFILLKNRKGKKLLELSDNGIIISEQLADQMELSVNDNFLANKSYNLKIKGITENYVDNFVYMTKEYYSNMFLEDVKFNKVLVIDNMSKEDANKILLVNTNVLNTNFIIDDILAMERLLNQVIILAIVLVLAAGFLAVVVIYNLSNVNISERDKELSTLKVLGYKNNEVSDYIFREINIMLVISLIVGTPLGLLLHHYIIISIEEGNMMMGRGVKWYAILLSMFITVVVTLLVQVIMKRKINKIDMISALKEL